MRNKLRHFAGFRSVAVARLTLVVAVLATGCAATKIADYPPTAHLSAQARTAEKSAMKITVDPFFDARRSGTYFKVNALKQGMLVLHLHFENQSSDTTYLAHKENFRLVTATGNEQTASQKVGHSSAAGDAVALTGAALGSLPLLFIGGQMVADAEAVRQNFVSKELQNRTLAPGQSLAGFVYYHLPKNQTQSGSATFRVRVPATNGRETVEFEFPLNYEKQ